MPTSRTVTQTISKLSRGLGSRVHLKGSSNTIYVLIAINVESSIDSKKILISSCATSGRGRPVIDYVNRRNTATIRLVPYMELKLVVMIP